MLKKLLKKFLFDIRCPLCNEETSENNYICKRCSKKIDDMGSLKKKDDLYYLYYYNDVKKIIYDLKFLNRKGIAKEFRDKIKISLEKIIEVEEIDGIIIIPISKNRRLERGFNQVQELLCDFDEYLIKSIRLKDTEHMYKISNIKNREKNIKDVFFIKENLKNKNILIFDDIVTTGSTMKEMKKYLETKGTKKVILFSLTVVKEYLKKIGMCDDGNIYK